MTVHCPKQQPVTDVVQWQSMLERFCCAHDDSDSDPTQAYLKNAISIMRSPFGKLPKRVCGGHHFSNCIIEGPSILRDVVLASP